MSDLQDLIHKNAKIAYSQGEQREQIRIIRLLVDAVDLELRSYGQFIPDNDYNRIKGLMQAIDLIRGEK